jgi:hypothetical protein
MFDAYGQFQASSIASSGGSPRYDPAVQAVGRGVSQFHGVHWKAQLKRAWGTLTGRSYRLLDLDDVRRNATVEAMYEGGCQTIEIRKIRGSECRVCDFDDDWLPVKRSAEERWARIFAARRTEKPLPAISVVQVGDVYYVRDGHHRVSVARVLGEEYIEAHVQVWQLKGPSMPVRSLSAALLAVV